MYFCEQFNGIKWANLLWIILIIKAWVQHVLTIRTLSSFADFKYQIKYLNIFWPQQMFAKLALTDTKIKMP